MASFRLKTFPEILAAMFAHVRGVKLTTEQGVEPDLTPGSALRTFLEACALSDADQYVQISKLKKLFGLFTAKGDDLDQRMVDFGSEIWDDLKRRKANTSISQITVGDGTLLVKSTIAIDSIEGSTTFPVPAGEGAAFPSSGALSIEAGTARQEEIIYTRVGDTFTVVYPTTGTENGHPAGAALVRIAVKSTINGALLAGAGAATLATGTGAAWATSGTIIFERGTSREEKIAFTRVGDAITLVGVTAFGHADGSIVHQSTAGINRNIGNGVGCYAPATDALRQVNFRTKATGILYDGDFLSAAIPVESDDVGSATRVGANTIVAWTAAPFVGATVTNPIAATRGREREDDSAYLQRALNFIQSLSRGTPLAVTTAISGVRDPVSNRTVEFVQIVEPVAPGESLLYITDGTSSFAIEYLPFIGRDVIISDAEVGDRRGRLAQYAPFNYSTVTPVTPRLFKSINRGEATAVGVNFLEDGAQAMITDYYVGAYVKTDDNQFYKVTSNTAIRFNVSAGGATPSNGSYAIIDFGTNPQINSVSTGVGPNSITDITLAMVINENVGKYLKDSAGVVYPILSNTPNIFTLDITGRPAPSAGAYQVTAGSPEPLVPGTDFLFNRSKGDLELSLANALVAHDCLVAASDGASLSEGAYQYSASLGAYVQRLINGDDTDFDSFPGLRATGTQIFILSPTVVAPTFILKVVAARGFNDSDITLPVKTAVQVYVNSLGIGDNIILAEIVAAVMAVPGVADCVVLSPSANVIVPSGQLPRIGDTNVEML